MTRRRTFLGGIVALIVSLLVLAATSPTHVVYWVASAIVIWWAAPYLGATSLPAMVARHGPAEGLPLR